MTVEELLVDLARRRIQVWTEGDNLNVRAPKGTLCTRAAHRTHRAQAGDHVALEPRTCQRHGGQGIPALIRSAHILVLLSDGAEQRSLQCHACRVDPLGPRHSQVAACMPGAGRSPCPAQDHLCHSRRRARPAGPRPSGHLFEVTDAAAWDWDTLDSAVCRRLPTAPSTWNKAPCSASTSSRDRRTSICSC